MTSERGITPKQAQKIRAAKGLVETNLQRIRVAKGLSQQGLADVSGVAKRAIECYEQRTRNIDKAQIETLCNLSIALGCDIADILECKELIEKYKKIKREK